MGISHSCAGSRSEINRWFDRLTMSGNGDPQGLRKHETTPNVILREAKDLPNFT